MDKKNFIENCLVCFYNDCNNSEFVRISSEIYQRLNNEGFTYEGKQSYIEARDTDMCEYNYYFEDVYLIEIPNTQSIVEAVYMVEKGVIL